jgi:hypothetical protein
VTVGSLLPKQRLSDAEICAEYLAGRTQAWLGLKARMSSARVREILIANGVRLRTSPEVRRLAVRTRMGTRWPTRPVFKGDE